MDDQAPAPKRKKSQKRQRDKQIKTPLTSDEFNRVAARAANAGLTHAAYSRAAMLGDAGPRSKARLPVDAELLRQVLAELGRYGNNWNQVAYKLNTGAAPLSLQGDVLEEIGNLHQIRDLILTALGHRIQPA
jgi:hypothetical protein